MVPAGWPGLAALGAGVLFLVVLGLAFCRSRAAVSDATSQALLPVSIRGSRQGSRFSSPSLRWPESARGRTCMPCTCECDSPMCQPTPCSRAAAAEALKQVAELELALERDERTVRLLARARQTPPSGIMYAPDVPLFARKLIAECGTARAALQLLDHACEFRRYHRIDEILALQMPAEFVCKARAVVPHGLHKTDKWGHPLYIERVGQIVPAEMTALWSMGADLNSLPPRARECVGLLSKATLTSAPAQRCGKIFAQPFNAAILYHFQMVEYARLEYEAQARLHGRRVCKMVSVLDLSELRLGMFTCRAAIDRLGALSKLGDLLTVENLAAIWIVNAPFFFAKCWQAVSHMLVPRTAEKLKVLSPRESVDFLRTVVPAENLPVWLGGSCECEGGCISGHGRPSAMQRKADAQIEAWAASSAACGSALVARAAPAPAADEAPCAPRAQQRAAPFFAALRSALFLRCFLHSPPGSPASRLHAVPASESHELACKGGLSATPSAGDSEDAPSHELHPTSSGSTQRAARPSDGTGGAGASTISGLPHTHATASRAASGPTGARANPKVGSRAVGPDRV
ncbi:hypothetical protein KFE25_002530 [Diacronema lutheri]|uniref:CRAL-TRIO domain-containing protein n=1 Tax=Diacronema lutheri TaxID=2081491 RepID=A0A8J5X4F8_DIALT|nr:hypothetical protein KFE25_002530 [Diacronema lutheri]